MEQLTSGTTNGFLLSANFYIHLLFDKDDSKHKSNKVKAKNAQITTILQLLLLLVLL